MESKYPILALDVGDKRVGVAVLTSSKGVPAALDTYPRAKGVAESKILELLDHYQALTLVIGLPLCENMQETEQSEKIRRFARRIEKRSDVEIHFVDEYASSREAKGQIGPLSERKQILARKKGMIDAVSASIILQRYISGEVVSE